MKKFIIVGDTTHTLELYGTSHDGRAYVCIDNWFFHWLKMYYRHERTLDDHMGNTECGYYVKAPFSHGKVRRVYISDLM